MSRSISRLAHGARRLVRGWSRSKDRDYHDSLFSAQDFNPFSDAYSGYVTIRRFADLAEPILRNATSALDLGCGCGEITCELARRCPSIALVGVDHSAVGIARAREHAERLLLKNVRFEVADVESYRPTAGVGAVLLFDAFHHLQAPAEFARRLREFTDCFVLVEPRGDWKGSWRRDLDFDWLVPELEKVRQRVAHQVGEATPSDESAAASESPPPRAQATEHRYSYDDFVAFFEGMAVSVRGTVAGFEVYPEDPHRPSPTRERFGRVLYDLVKEIDERLFESGRDVLAKHWLVVAEKHGQAREVRWPQPSDSTFGGDSVQGPYDVEYVSYSGPDAAPPDTELRAIVRLRNRGWRSWSSHDEPNPVNLSYRWLDRRGIVAQDDGLRTRLPRVVTPGEECEIEMAIRSPRRPGRYLLSIDLVHEGITWFSQFGCPARRVQFRVR